MSHVSYRPEWWSTSYLDARRKFLASATRVCTSLPAQARLTTIPLEAGPDPLPENQKGGHGLHEPEPLCTDILEVTPSGNREHLLLVTTGEHGLEGFSGSALTHLILEHFLPQLDLTRVGLSVVHAINPWGMAHGRRVNRNNVDLNRNFVWEEELLARPDRPRSPDSPLANPAFEALEGFLSASRPVSFAPLERARFGASLALVLARHGSARLKDALLRGQYTHPAGPYFGGHAWQPETRAMMAFFRRCLEAYPAVTVVDIHTGYGPRDSLTLVGSPLEKRSRAELIRLCGYPEISKTDGSDFYQIQGDMMDYLYRLRDAHFPDRTLLAATYELGTLGAGTRETLQALFAILQENRHYHHGGLDQARIDAQSRALFYPSESAWHRNAGLKLSSALQGVLAGQGLLSPSQRRA